MPVGRGRRGERAGAVLRLRERMSITIYGSYWPAEELDFLNRQTAFLASKGYTDSKIVPDRDPKGGDALESSRRCLQFSDVNFLVFTRDGKKHGLVRELALVADAMITAPKAHDCVAFYQGAEMGEAIPVLSISDIKKTRMRAAAFSDEADLQDAMLKTAWWYLLAKRRELEGRAHR